MNEIECDAENFVNLTQCKYAGVMNKEWQYTDISQSVLDIYKNRIISQSWMICKKKGTQLYTNTKIAL